MKNKSKYESINYIYEIRELMKFEVDINFKARLIHLENCINNDINNILSNEREGLGKHEQKEIFINKVTSKLQDIDPEFTDIVNKEFWNLI